MASTSGSMNSSASCHWPTQCCGAAMVCFAPQAMSMSHGTAATQPLQVLWMSPIAAESAGAFWSMPVNLVQPDLAMPNCSYPALADGSSAVEGGDVLAPQQYQMNSFDCSTRQPAGVESSNLISPLACTSMPPTLSVSEQACRTTLRRRTPSSQAAAPTIKPALAWADMVDDVSEAEEVVEEPAQNVSAECAADVRQLGQLLLDQLVTDDHAGRQAAVTRFAQMSFADKDSSRAAQEALTTAPPWAAVMMADGLRGRIWEAVQCKYANYVVQRIVEVLPAHRSSFVAEELQGYAVELARHKVGCRILCRIVEHTTFADGQSPAEALLLEVLSDAKLLLRHTYGGYVVRHVLEYGPSYIRQRIVADLAADVYRSSRNKQGSRTIVAALTLCTQEDRRKIASCFLADADQFVRSAGHQFGSKAVGALLETGVEESGQAASMLEEASAVLQQSKYGRHVLAAVTKSRQM